METNLVKEDEMGSNSVKLDSMDTETVEVEKMDLDIVVEDYSNNLLQRIYKLQQKRTLCNVDLICREGTLSAHRLILMTSESKYLQKHLIADSSSKICQVPLADFSMESVTELVKYLYTGEFKLHLNLVAEMIELFDFLGIKDCFDSLTDFLNNDTSGIFKEEYEKQKETRIRDKRNKKAVSLDGTKLNVQLQLHPLDNQDSGKFQISLKPMPIPNTGNSPKDIENRSMISTKTKSLQASCTVSPHENIPVKSKNLPVKSKTTPVKSKNIPVKSKTTPVKSKNICTTKTAALSISCTGSSDKNTNSENTGVYTTKPRSSSTTNNSLHSDKSSEDHAYSANTPAPVISFGAKLTETMATENVDSGSEKEVVDIGSEKKVVDIGSEKEDVDSGSEKEDVDLDSFDFDDIENNVDSVEMLAEDELILTKGEVISQSPVNPIETVNMLKLETDIETSFQKAGISQGRDGKNFENVTDPDANMDAKLKYKSLFGKKNHAEVSSLDVTSMEINDVVVKQKDVKKKSHTTENVKIFLPFECGLCCTGFSELKNLEKHVKTHYTDETFTCNIDGCGKKFKHKLALDNHKENHKIKSDAIRVKSKDGVVLYKGELKDTVGENRPTDIKMEPNSLRPIKTYQLDKLASSVSCLSDDYEHDKQKKKKKKLSDERRFKCEECGKCFKRKGHLQNHMSVHSGEKPWICEACGKSFSKKEGLRDHIKLHTGDKPHICDICGQAYVKRRYLLVHMRKHTGERPFVCHVCGKSFARPAVLRRHLESHEVTERLFSCELCGKSFREKRVLDCHIKTHDQEKPFQCSVCGKTFKFNAYLQNHTKLMHSDIEPYTCDTCGRGFKISQTYRRHVLSHVKKDERPFKCDVCDRRYTEAYLLRKHKRIHSNIRPHKCEECGKGFLSQGHLRQHMNIHKPDRQLYMCDLCGKALSNSVSLKYHRKTHQEIKFQCDVCDKGFREKETFERHMRVHSGLKPYQCELCGSGFTRSNALKKHMSKHDENSNIQHVEIIVDNFFIGDL